MQKWKWKWNKIVDNEQQNNFYKPLMEDSALQCRIHEEPSTVKNYMKTERIKYAGQRSKQMKPSIIS